MTEELEKYNADIQKILEILPHRYPFLLIDKIIDMVPGKTIKAIKNVSANEPFFQGHFPGRPVMPGVLIMEAMAQSAAFLAKCSPGYAAERTNIFLVGATDFKWKRTVLPGDTLLIETESYKKKGPLWVVKSVASVEGKIAASGTISAMEVP